MVCVKPTVLYPKYKWGAINHSNSGIVKKISPDGVECQVDFCQQSGWTGLVSEMELTAAAHTGIRWVFTTSRLNCCTSVRITRIYIVKNIDDELHFYS